MEILKSSELADVLNTAVIDLAEEFNQPIQQELEFENILDTVFTRETYAEASVEYENLIQAYQGKFTPTGTISIGSHHNTLQTMKSDLEFPEDMTEDFFNTQFPEYHPAGYNSMEEHPFVQMFLNEFFYNGWKTEMNKTSVKGVRVAPTVGTAGTPLGAIDGFAKVFNDLITAGKLNTITTGIVNQTNIVDAIFNAIMEIPEDIRDIGGTVFIPTKWAIWYSQQYKKSHSNASPVVENPTGRFLLLDEFENFMLKPIKAMSGENRAYIDIKKNGKSNMIVGKHKTKPDMPQLTFYPKPRGLDATASWHRFYGLRRYEYTFVTKTA